MRKNNFYTGEGLYEVNRFTLRYGREWDPMDCTTKYFETEKAAVDYAFRYARGLKFCSAEVTAPSGDIILEICDYGSKVFDYRNRKDVVL